MNRLKPNTATRSSALLDLEFAAWRRGAGAADPGGCVGGPAESWRHFPRIWQQPEVEIAKPEKSLELKVSWAKSRAHMQVAGQAGRVGPADQATQKMHGAARGGHGEVIPPCSCYALALMPPVPFGQGRQKPGTGSTEWAFEMVKGMVGRRSMGLC